MDSENQCRDPEHRLTLCEINSIKTDKIYGYIIKRINISCQICKVAKGIYVTTPYPYRNILTNKTKYRLEFFFDFQICHFLLPFVIFFNFTLIIIF